MKASEYYKTQPVNHVQMTFHSQTVGFLRKKTVSDGTVTVSIFKYGWKRSYRFKARNLNQPNEEILEDEGVESS